MKYSRDDLDKAIAGLYDELRTIRNKKGHDYSIEEDVISNLRQFGWKGVVVQIGQKWSRLVRFYWSGVLKVKDENIDDTMLDMINYLLFCLILYREEKKCNQKPEA